MERKKKNRMREGGSNVWPVPIYLIHCPLNKFCSTILLHNQSETSSSCSSEDGIEPNHGNASASDCPQSFFYVFIPFKLERRNRCQLLGDVLRRRTELRWRIRKSVVLPCQLILFMHSSQS